MTALHQNKLPQIIIRSGPIMRRFQSVAGAKMSCNGNIGQYTTEKSMPPRKQTNKGKIVICKNFIKNQMSRYCKEKVTIWSVTFLCTH